MKRRAARDGGQKSIRAHRLSRSWMRHAAWHRTDFGREDDALSAGMRRARIVVWVLLVVSVIGYLLLAVPPAVSRTRQIMEQHEAQVYRSQFGSSQAHEAVYSERALKALRSKVRDFDRNRRSVSVKDPFTPYQISSSAAYSRLVSRMPGKVVGTLTIPSIGLDRQIAPGVNLSSIEGVEHLPQTALPSDIDGINPVLVGHNGETDDPAFNDLPKVKKGQQFVITTLGQELVYKVDSITTVRPTNISSIRAVKGKRYATLMTCTPRYINEFRLLVRGRLVAVRTFNPSDMAGFSPTGIMPAWVPLAVCFLVITVFAWAVIGCVHAFLTPTTEQALLVANSRVVPGDAVDTLNADVAGRISEGRR